MELRATNCSILGSKSPPCSIRRMQQIGPCVAYKRPDNDEVRTWKLFDWSIPRKVKWNFSSDIEVRTRISSPGNISLLSDPHRQRWIFLVSVYYILSDASVLFILLPIYLNPPTFALHPIACQFAVSGLRSAELGASDRAQSRDTRRHEDTRIFLRWHRQTHRERASERVTSDSGCDLLFTHHTDTDDSDPKASQLIEERTTQLKRIRTPFACDMNSDEMCDRDHFVSTARHRYRWRVREVFAKQCNKTLHEIDITRFFRDGKEEKTLEEKFICQIESKHFCVSI